MDNDKIIELLLESAELLFNESAGYNGLARRYYEKRFNKLNKIETPEEKRIADAHNKLQKSYKMMNSGKYKPEEVEEKLRKQRQEIQDKTKEIVSKIHEKYKDNPEAIKKLETRAYNLQANKIAKINAERMKYNSSGFPHDGVDDKFNKEHVFSTPRDMNNGYRGQYGTRKDPIEMKDDLERMGNKEKNLSSIHNTINDNLEEYEEYQKEKNK